MATKTRIAVVGYGLIGKRHTQAVLRDGAVELAAIVESTETGRQDAASLGAPVYDSIQTMCDKIRPDGVILATPTPVHVEQGLTCIEAGCAVLIEKPVAVTAQDAMRLTKAAEKASVPLLVGHHRRHNGMVRAAKQAIEDGAIGAVRSVQATCWFYKPDHYFDVAPWRTRKGAGPISVNLVHDVDLLRHFCGEVIKVQAASVPSVRGFENEDLASAILTFQSGAVATISVSDSIVSPWSWELTAGENPAYPETRESCYLIGGSAGALSLPDLRVWAHQQERDWWTPISATSLVCDSQDPLAVQIDHFVQVIRDGVTPLVSGVEGMRSLQVVEAIATAATTGEPVVIDPLQGMHDVTTLRETA